MSSSSLCAFKSPIYIESISGLSKSLYFRQQGQRTRPALVAYSFYLPTIKEKEVYSKPDECLSSAQVFEIPGLAAPLGMWCRK